jgi:hypothetical protein
LVLSTSIVALNWVSTVLDEARSRLSTTVLVALVGGKAIEESKLVAVTGGIGRFVHGALSAIAREVSSVGVFASGDVGASQSRELRSTSSVVAYESFRAFSTIGTFSSTSRGEVLDTSFGSTANHVGTTYYISRCTLVRASSSSSEVSFALVDG